MRKEVIDHINAEHTALYNKRTEEAKAHCDMGTCKDDDLMYAAHARCPCGAGMAYHKGIGVWGFWDCSAILTGRADRAVKHEARLPFSFYEIKSEDQPSTNGATTRAK